MAVLFPFRINWATPYRMKMSFLTDIFESDAGTEYRRAKRQKPRISTEFSIQLHREELTKWKSWISTHHNKSIAMPDFCRSISTAGLPTDGGTKVTLVEVPWWVVEDRSFALDNGQGYLTDVTVIDITGNILTFTQALPNCPIGSILHPLLTGRIDAELSASRPTSSIASVAVRFEVDPNYLAFPQGSAGEVFLGKEVFTFNPNWENAINDSHIWPVEVLDYEVGAISVERDIEFPTLQKSANFTFFDGEAWALFEFFLRCRGAQKEFYAPLEDVDLIPSRDLVAGQSFLHVKGTDAAFSFGVDTTREVIQIEAGGTVERKMVIAVLPLTDESVIFFDTPLASDFALDSVSRLTWTLNSRFATDSLEFEWITDRIAMTKVTLKSLPVSMQSFDFANYSENYLQLETGQNYQFEGGNFIETES